jgi:putative nucleotidyltransferase with HDIG domain
MPNDDSVARIEHIAHRRRVGDLCSRTARSLSIEALTEFALTLASAVHQDRPSGIQERNEANAIVGTDPKDPSFGSVVIEMAEAILHRRPGRSKRRDRDIDLAGQIFEACDEFDEAIEFGAYDGASITTAINEFFHNADSRRGGRVYRALRKITSPDIRLTLPGELPVLPAAAAKLIRTPAERVSELELESIAASDPVLAGRLLGVSNSAFFGPSAQILQLKQAILRLGVPFTRKVLLEACFGPLFASSTLAELWHHSRLVAANTHELAGECGYDQETAYVAGLLHDIGRLVMFGCPPEIRVAEAERIAAGFPLVYAETLVYGTDHAAIGSDLLKVWGLPAEITEAVAHHHRPESTDSLLAGILYLAEDDSVGGSWPSETLSPGMRRARAIHGFSRGRINRESPSFSLAG